MIRVTLCLAAIAQLPLAVVWSAPPTASRVPGLQCQPLDPTAVAPLQVNQLSDPSTEGAPGPEPIDLGPMDLGLIEQALRSTPTSALWKDPDPSHSMWASFEYMAIWVKGSHVPPAPSGGAPSTLLFQEAMQTGGTSWPGDQRLDAGMHSGERITAGIWLKGKEVGVEASFFTLQPESTHFSTGAGTR